MTQTVEMPQDERSGQSVDRPLHNRVDPTGEFRRHPARGTMMGNRGGRLHDPMSRTLTSKRRWSGKAWICCALAFKNRKREVWGDGYTELFFLDEVTALNAGHRPCFECRRQHAVAFQDAFARSAAWSASGSDRPRARQIDHVLHRARIARPMPPIALNQLVEGSMMMDGDHIVVRGPKEYLVWSFAGYDVCNRAPSTRGRLITPDPIFHTLNAGYKPTWHPSAHQEISACR